MRLLLDTCVWGGTLSGLIALGHDVQWTGDLATDPGDEAILQLAFEQQRILITLDKDFGELAVHRGKPHAGIIRLVDIPAMMQAELASYAVERYGDQLQEGAILTVERNRIRIRTKD